MTPCGLMNRLAVAARAVRWMRLCALLLAALAAGLISDALRRERVFFPRPPPEFTSPAP
jgi:hypothetical protein